MVLQESGEMYLESILVLIRQGKAVRSIDIVDYMGYSKPSGERYIPLISSIAWGIPSPASAAPLAC